MDVDPIFSGNGKVCRKGGTAAGMLVGISSDVLLARSNPPSLQPDEAWRPIGTSNRGGRWKSFC